MKIDFYQKGLIKCDFCGLPKKPLVAIVFIIIYDIYLIRFKVFTKFHDHSSIFGQSLGQKLSKFSKGQSILTIYSVSITVSDDICNILPQGMDNGIAQFVSRESGKLNLMFILRL